MSFYKDKEGCPRFAYKGFCAGWLVSMICTAVCLAEFRVNSSCTYNQADAAITADANGGLFIVWSSYLADGSSNGICGQKFDSNTCKIGPEFVVNQQSDDNQRAPDVASDSNGNFIVVWEGPGGGDDETDIYGRRFDSNGQWGDEFRINNTTEDDQISPSVAANANGDFIVVWESINQPEPDKRSICCQSYDRLGDTVGNELVISDEPSVCRRPDVVLDSTGEAIVIWIGSESLHSIRVRHFAADGNEPTIFSKQVNDGLKFTSLTNPSIAIDDQDNYVIAWDGHPTGGDYDDIYLRIYHFSHMALHDQHIVNTEHNADQTNPSIAICDDNFIVTWEDDSETESTQRNILGRRFVNTSQEPGNPTPLGDEFSVNTYTVDDQKYPASLMKKTGDFITVWQSKGQDGSGYGIFAQDGPNILSADIAIDGFVDLMDYSLLAGEWEKQEDNLAGDLVDDNIVNANDLAAFCRQWLTPRWKCTKLDLNGDGKINLVDYCLWADNFLKKGPEQIPDINKDGIIDWMDLQAISFNWACDCGE